MQFQEDTQRWARQLWFYEAGRGRGNLITQFFFWAYRCFLSMLPAIRLSHSVSCTCSFFWGIAKGQSRSTECDYTPVPPSPLHSIQHSLEATSVSIESLLFINGLIRKGNVWNLCFCHSILLKAFFLTPLNRKPRQITLVLSVRHFTGMYVCTRNESGMHCHVLLFAFAASRNLEWGFESITLISSAWTLQYSCNKGRQRGQLLKNPTLRAVDVVSCAFITIIHLPSFFGGIGEVYR